MEHLLYLTHRIPYPPNKGDKIRSFNLLKELLKHYRVHLGCFIDDPNDIKHISYLSDICETICCLPQHHLSCLLKGSTSVMRGLPITVPYYGSRKMEAWVNETIKAHRISRALVFSSSMAQYVDKQEHRSLRRIIDFVDVDSDKWRQYALKKQGPARWIYQREHRMLQQYENRITHEFDRALLVSDDEAALLRKQLPPELHSKVDYLLNGVDTKFFDPRSSTKPDVNRGAPFIAFTGAMDYWANADAVQWFCDNVWGRLQRLHPNLHFMIVGGNPTEQVRGLAATPGVTVTGRVDDIRPYIEQAEFVVAPMQIARGIQNKVLEALAMGKPVIATSMAMEGINAPSSLCVEVADTAQAFALACEKILNHDAACEGSENRLWVQKQFSWDSKLASLFQTIEGR